VDHPAPHGPPPDPYVHGEPEPAGGLDLLSRVAVPGKRTPPFVLPGPPPSLPARSYPGEPAPRQPSTLSLDCAQAEPSGGAVVDGALPPARAGAVVTLPYTPPAPPGAAVTHTTSTDAQGSFADRFVPAGHGVFRIQASWGGDGALLPATSEPCVI